MGRRRRLQEAQEAEALRRKKRRVGLLAAFFLVLGTALVGFWFIRPKAIGPQGEEERLIRLAAERGWFVFGVHFSAEDFARIESHVEAAFREARERGQRVVLVEELGTIGVPQDSATKKTPPARQWLDLIARDPARQEAWFRRTMDGWSTGADRLKRGEYCAPDYYTDNPSGSYMKPLHALLIRNRDILEDVVHEDLGWEDYLEGMRMDDLEERALEAYIRGSPDESLRLVRERDGLSRRNRAGRDRRLVLQMGRLMDGRDDLVAVTVRGVGHWDLAARHGLRQARKPDWGSVLAVSHGAFMIQLLRLMGTPAAPEEEDRAYLSHVPSSLLMGHLRASGRARTVHEAAEKGHLLTANPALTRERLRELSFALWRVRIEDPARAAAFVHDWLASRGLLD